MARMKEGSDVIRYFLMFCYVIGALAAIASAQTPDVVSTREMSDINWMEFKEVVPSKINTVILPTGTLEPHGVINNGADITAPIGIARKIAREVNAMIAPIIPYGITGRWTHIPELSLFQRRRIARTPETSWLVWRRM